MEGGSSEFYRNYRNYRNRITPIFTKETIIFKSRATNIENLKVVSQKE